MNDENEVLPAEEVIEEPALDEQPEEPAEDLEQIRKDAKAFKDQKTRAENAERELKELKKKAPLAAGALSPEAEARITRSELFGLGIKDADDQKYVTDAAKRLGVSVYEAANDELITAKLDKMREARQTKDATPSPTRGSGGGTANVTKLAEKALATGELPTDPATREKVRAEMRRISK